MSDRAKFIIINNVIILTVSIGLFIGGLFLKQDFTLVGYMNSAFYTGGIIILLGLLAMVIRLGAFDMFVYGFKDILFYMNPSKDKEKQYKDYPAYIEAKKEERSKKTWDFLWPYLYFGGTFLLFSIIIRIFFYAV